MAFQCNSNSERPNKKREQRRSTWSKRLCMYWSVKTRQRGDGSAWLHWNLAGISVCGEHGRWQSRKYSIANFVYDLFVYYLLIYGMSKFTFPTSSRNKTAKSSMMSPANSIFEYSIAILWKWYASRMNVLRVFHQ